MMMNINKIVFILLLPIFLNATSCVNLIERLGFENSKITINYCDDMEYKFEIQNKIAYVFGVGISKDEFILLIEDIKKILILSEKAKNDNLLFQKEFTIKEDVMNIKYYSKQDIFVIDMKRELSYKLATFSLVGKENIVKFLDELQKQFTDSDNKLSKIKN